MRGHLDLRADAEYSVLEADFQIVTDVLAALRPVAPALATARRTDRRSRRNRPEYREKSANALGSNPPPLELRP